MINDDGLKAVGCIGILLGVIALVVVGIILNGYVLSIAWAMFIAPKFGLPNLTISEAIFLSSFISYMTSEIPKDNKDKSSFDKWATIFYASIFRPLLWWLTISIIAYWLPTYG